jgi:hypothetical protein
MHEAPYIHMTPVTRERYLCQQGKFSRSLGIIPQTKTAPIKGPHRKREIMESDLA